MQIFLFEMLPTVHYQTYKRMYLMQMFMYICIYVCMTLFSSTVDVMTAIIANSTISTINATGSTTQPSMSICADSPSSTACMMAIEDDETGNDTIIMLCMGHTLHMDTKALVQKRLSGLCIYIHKFHGKLF